MSRGPEPADRRVVVVGGGTAALEAVLALSELGGGRLDLLLLAPGRHFIHRTLQDGEPRTIRVPLATLAQRGGFTHLRDALERVDVVRRVIHTQDGSVLAYDTLVLAVGARPIRAVPGALTYRGPHDLARLDQALHRHAGRPRLRVVFAVPGGVADPRPLYEVAVHTAERLEREGIGPDVVVVTPEVGPLHDAAPGEADELAAALERHGVEVCARTLPGFVADGRLWTAAHGGVRADLVVALPYVAGPAVDGIGADGAGFALVDDDGRVEGTTSAYAIGSMATREPGPGGAAAQADALARLLVGIPEPESGCGTEIAQRGRLLGYIAEHGETVAALP